MYDELRHALEEQTKLNVEGGTMAMVAAEARDDAHRLRGARLGGPFVLLVVDF